jgi:hypothetical protein
MSAPFTPERPAAATADPGIGPFIPLMILALTLLSWFAFETIRLRVEQDALRTTIASQEKSMEDSRRLRASLEALMSGTAKLAEQGNPNARLVIDELKKHGVTITANPTPAVDAAK